MSLGSGASASGCLPYETYELGHVIEEYQTVGQFHCRESNGDHCIFKAEGEEKVFGKMWIDKKDLPPTEQDLVVQVTSSEAMRWYNCDGGDPVPPFERNGIYSEVQYQNVSYTRFVSDQGEEE